MLFAGTPQARDLCLPQGRLLLLTLCILTFSAVCVFLCCWACLPLCLATCLDRHLPAAPRSTVPGPLHFSGYSSVPDGKVSQPGNATGASGSPALGNSESWAGGKPAWTLSLASLLTSCVTSASHLSSPSTQGLGGNRIFTKQILPGYPQLHAGNEKRGGGLPTGDNLGRQEVFRLLCLHTIYSHKHGLAPAVSVIVWQLSIKSQPRSRLCMVPGVMKLGHQGPRQP